MRAVINVATVYRGSSHLTAATFRACRAELAITPSSRENWRASAAKSILPRKWKCTSRVQRRARKKVM